MWFDTEICEGVSCHECSFNKGEDGCLLAKRLDEIEIIPEPCEDALKKIKKDAIGIILHVAKISKHCSDFNDLDEVPECEDAVSKADVLETYADLYDVFEDNKQISKELHKVYDKLNALPSARPEVIRCKDCKDYQTDWETSYPNRHYCATMDSFMPEDGFCNYAKRIIDG